MDEDIFDRICSNVSLLNDEYENDSYFQIGGDMNARTADMDDLVPLDISTHMNVLPDD